VPKFRVNFFDKHGDEFRSVEVDAFDEDEALERACARADAEKWPARFKAQDAELIEEGE